jgi:competence protein ComEC
MPINTNGNLWIFCLNVGQGDTTVVATPSGKVLIFDAVRATKIIQLLEDLGHTTADPIEHIVVSHPHHDHYSGVERLLNTYSTVESVSLTSLRRVQDTTPSYNNIINTAVQNRIPLKFISGYSQSFPDDSPVADPGTLLLELLGPSNQFIEALFQSRDLDTNHYSIIARLNWRGFRMVIPGDAQMETWSHFDSEQMLSESCSVLRAAHHGSANGTQFERIDRLSPETIVVSSDPDGKDHIPDLIGSAIFLRYTSRAAAPLVVLTDNNDAVKNGTVKIDVRPSGRFDIFRYGDVKNQDVNLANEVPLTPVSNPTDWRTLTQAKLP